MSIGKCNVLTTELWGALEGLKLALKKGYKWIEIQIDNQEVTNILRGKVNKLKNMHILRNIKNVMAAFMGSELQKFIKKPTCVQTLWLNTI